MIPKEVIDCSPALGDWAIIIGYRGSIAHGMYVPNSDPNSIDDKDVMSICVPPIDYYLGLNEFGSRGTKEIKQGEWDIVIYEALKFIRLLAVGNPNVLSLLWLDEKHYIKRTPAGQMLIDNRDLFLGRHLHKSFFGYACGQLHKMTSNAFEGYMGDKRKRLVEKFGYDTKNAAHCIRILRMGIEALREGTVNVHRYDSQELLAIKRGEWTLEQVKADYTRLKGLLDDAQIISSLPKEPDREAINRLAVRVIREALSL